MSAQVTFNVFYCTKYFLELYNENTDSPKIITDLKSTY